MQSTGLGSNLRLIPSRFDFSDNLVNAVKPDPRVLARLIAGSFQDTDLVIIDCAPTESVFTRAAYHASRYVLIPVKPEFLATIGFPLLRRSLRTFKNENPAHDIDVIGVVINDTFDYQGDFAPEKAQALDEIYQEASENSWYVFENRLEYSRGFPKLMREKLRQLAWRGSCDIPAVCRRAFWEACTMTDSKLKASLQSLVQEHGLGKVLKSLGEIADAHGVGVRPRRRKRPATAPEYVSKLQLPVEKSGAVTELAERFSTENLSFRSFGDIANFCETYQIDIPASRTRVSAIPRVFKFIAEMEASEIQRILDLEMFSGPSRLGPISEAIRNHGIPPLQRQRRNVGRM